MAALPWRSGVFSAAAVRKALPPLIAVLLCGVLFGALRTCRSFDLGAVWDVILGLPPRLLLEAVLATVASYAALVLRDALGLREAGARPGWQTLLVGAVGAVAVGNAVGFGAVTGAAVRYRVYGAAGVTAMQVARITLLTNICFTLGLLALGGAGAILAAPALAPALGLRPGLLAGLGGLMLAGGLAPLLLGGRGGRPIRVWRLEFEPPARPVAMAQFALSVLDLLAAGTVLYCLLPEARIGLPTFLAIYSCATLLGVLSHAPAGLGAFDAVLLLALGGRAPAGTVVAGLLAFRAIYFLLPLAVAALLFAAAASRSFATRAIWRLVRRRLASAAS